jgi:hypothetical protein
MEPSVSEIARILGARGGRAKAAKLTQLQRSRISSQISRKRWAALTPQQRSEIGRARQRAKLANAIPPNEGEDEGEV